MTDNAEPKKLGTEDILALENSFLKIQNLKLQGDKLQADLLKCNEMMQAEQNKLREMRDNLSKRFGVDLAAAQILADGTIIPKKD